MIIEYWPLDKLGSHQVRIRLSALNRETTVVSLKPMFRSRFGPSPCQSYTSSLRVFGSKKTYVDDARSRVIPDIPTRSGPLVADPMRTACNLPEYGSGAVTSFSKVLRLYRSISPAFGATTISESRPAANFASSSTRGKYFTTRAVAASNTPS